jgi:nitrate reductase gamma subunit
MSASFLFDDFPRAALLVLVGGLLVRHGLIRRRISTVAAELPAVRWGGAARLGALALVLVLLVHVAALFAPRAFVGFTGTRTRLYLLEGGGFLVAMVALLAWARVIGGHLGAPGRVGLADSVLLALVALALGSGLITAVLYRWGSQWGVATLTPYARSLAKERPLGELAGQMPFWVRLHLIATFAALAVVPFTRLALRLIVPVHRSGVRLGGWLWRPARAAARYAGTVAARVNPASWIWPEEE